MEFRHELKMMCSNHLNISSLSEGKLVCERFRGNTGDNDNDYRPTVSYVWFPGSLLVSLSATLI